MLGDKVLRRIAGIFRDSIKGRDIAARIGGEEFALLLPQTTLEGARIVAEQIRSTIERGRICRDQSREIIGSITVSLGVAAGAPGETLETLMFRADQALYAAKRTGRNQVCVESPETHRLSGGEAHLELPTARLGEGNPAI